MTKWLAALAAIATAVLTGAAASSAAPGGGRGDAQKLRQIQHIVVIYEENHSFDNLLGGWPGVDGLARDPARTPRATQVGPDAARTPWNCLLQLDVNLTSPPLSPVCSGTTPAGVAFDSHFRNRPFPIDAYIRPTDTTCPPPGVFAANGIPKGQGLPGGCTRDLVHRFYNEQYQIDGGRMDRYSTGSDAAGLTQGFYDTRQLPIYRYLTGKRAPRSVVLDRFFQSAFGGSYLNHQWLVAARTPVYPNAVADGSAADLHSVVGADGFPASTPLHPTTGLKDAPLTQAANPDGSCLVRPGQPTPPPGTVCGDWSVNTIQPFYQPFAPGTADANRLPPQTYPNIGTRLSAAGLSWAWYSGGWDNANGNVNGRGWTNGTTPGTCTDPQHAAGAVYPNCPDALFQYHHQPLNYFASFAPGTAARAAHLRDEAEFESAANASKKHCELKPVSFIKPIGAENEHPGYASEHSGSSHLVDLLSAIQSSRCAKGTMVIVTYDEFGGQWDHGSPPGQGRRNGGPHDAMGPGTRIPAL
ncbi:MAG: alkaline phosphatase family protein, partial [Gaiellaceae bacterium]